MAGLTPPMHRSEFSCCYYPCVCFSPIFSPAFISVGSANRLLQNEHLVPLPNDAGLALRRVMPSDRFYKGASLADESTILPPLFRRDIHIYATNLVGTPRYRILSSAASESSPLS